MLLFLSVSESGSGSTLPDPNLLVKGMDPDSDQDLDLFVRGMDPEWIRIWMHSKISWIWNTGFDFVDITRASANSLTPLQQSPGLYWHSRGLYKHSICLYSYGLYIRSHGLYKHSHASKSTTTAYKSPLMAFQMFLYYMSSKTKHFEET